MVAGNVEPVNLNAECGTRNAEQETGANIQSDAHPAQTETVYPVESAAKESLVSTGARSSERHPPNSDNRS
jgi:hypothetical protein